MRILFITFSDIAICSSSNIRNVSLIKGLLDIGHSVDIITYKTNNRAQVQDETFKLITDRCKVFEISSVLASERVSANLLSKGSKSIKVRLYGLLRKIYYALEPVDSLRRTALSLNIDGLELGGYDLMISSSNPYSVHILAERIKNKYFKSGIKWAQYWGDALYFDTLIRHPIFPGRLKKAEYNLIRNCDAIVYTNAVILEKQKKLFSNMADKMTYIETPYAFAEKNDKKEFTYQVGYFGSFSTVVRDITPLYSVLSKESYRSVIIGNGDVAIDSTESLEVMPRATVSVVRDYEENTRILACICNKLPSNKKETGLIPGKAYHYGASEKPILVIGASLDVEAFLKKYNRFIFVDNDSNQIKKAIDALLSQPFEKKQPIAEVEPTVAANKFIESITFTNSVNIGDEKRE